MVFSNLLFIYLFLPLNLILYYCSRSIRWRNGVLIAFSLVFYAWGEPVWVFMLMLTALWDFGIARLIQFFRGTWLARAGLICSAVLDLGLLVLFKYSGFLVENLNLLTGLSLPVPSLTLPIGISFYTFQTLTYIVDVYRGTVEAQTSYWKYLMYLSSYHQLVAGPIVRYSDIAREIDHRTVSVQDMSEGITRLCTGLAKKVVVANTAGRLVSQYMDGDLSSLSVAGAWFGAVMFAIQLYYDFSAYSDMAIGLGRMFGFHYKTNFNYPYVSSSVTQFWRRWHISLSSVFRDYVYIPLGGNRRHQLFNILVVWMLTGLWHGASWNFVLWGLYYGVLLILEKLFLLRLLEKIPRVFSHLYLLLLATVGWTVFYHTSLDRLAGYLRVMFGLGGRPLWDTQLPILVANNIFWIVLAVVFCAPVTQWVKGFLAQRATQGQRAAAAFCAVLMNLALLFVSTSMLVGQSYNPFLYFRF